MLQTKLKKKIIFIFNILQKHRQFSTYAPFLPQTNKRKWRLRKKKISKRSFRNDDAKEATFDMEAAYLMMTAFSGTYLILYVIATVMLTLHQFIRTKVRCVSTVHFGLTIFFSPKKKITWKGLDD